MSSAYKVITPVAQEPVTLSRVKQYLNVDFDDNDVTIADLIVRARSLCETISARALATQTIREDFTIEAEDMGLYASNDGFSESQGGPWSAQGSMCFTLSVPPLQSLTSIETRASLTSAFTAFTGSYVIDDTSEPARVYIESPVAAAMWRFTYVAGYSSAYIAPPDLLQGICEAVAYFYENREAQSLPQAIKDKFLAKRAIWV